MNGNKFLLDTNAAGLYLDDQRFAANYLKPGAISFISVITQFKFLSNPELNTKSRFFFDEFVGFIKICPFLRETKELVNQVVAIRKKYKLKLPDTIITGTAIVNNTRLPGPDDIFSKIHNLKFQFIKS